jgi:hypothetical protein
MVTVGSGLTALKRERDVAYATVFSIGYDPESHFPAHLQHDSIFLQNLTRHCFRPSDLAYPIISCIKAQPRPLPLRSDLSRIAYSPVLRIESQ